AYPFGKTISHHDLILMQNDENLKKALQPDLLITIGKSVLSKALKQFLRKYPPRYHWHFQEFGQAPDTFRSLTHVLPISPEKGLEYYLSYTRKKLQKDAYFKLWFSEELKAEKFLASFFKKQEVFSEFGAMQALMQNLPENSLLHLANSMPVRYANYLSLPPEKNIEVFANRGTSGIDGSNSTAVGSAIATDKVVTLITGDMAFLYDRNAFWHNHLPENLRIVVLNNFGGGIFRLLPESGKLPELENFFETQQKSTAKQLTEEFGLEYFLAKNQEELQEILQTFFEPSQNIKVLEIQTQNIENQVFFEDFKKKWLKSLEN
ncbi:MAG: thiamine pyrophosphate-dependent enzyme, partial [Raineya sp.]